MGVAARYHCRFHVSIYFFGNMKIQLLSICSIGLLAISLSSCENIYEGGQTGLPDVPVQLKAQIVPYDKDKPEAIEAGASVGVYMVSSESDELMASNLKMSVDADGMIDTGDLLHYPKDGSKVNIISYLPYEETASVNNLISLDVSTAAAAVKSDYLYSANRNKYMALAPVKVQFKHILAEVMFDVKAGEGVTDEDLKGVTFAFQNLPAQADFNLITGQLSLHDVSGLIPVNLTDSGHRGENFVLPGSVGNLSISCTLKGMTFTRQLGPIDLKSGNIYKFDVTVSEPGFDIVLRQIEDWIVEEY